MVKQLVQTALVLIAALAIANAVIVNGRRRREGLYLSITITKSIMQNSMF